MELYIIGISLLIVFGILLLLAIYDIFQHKHTITRNFPIIGHLRFILEKIGPELRQYIVTDNDSERPFSRDQRRWIYSSAKKQNTNFGFGTDQDLDNATNYIIVKQSSFPYIPDKDSEIGNEPDWKLPSTKTIGEFRNRKNKFTPQSVINISGMSYGALGPAAITALNKGAAIAGALQSTGEGSISSYHKNGADLIWQIGTGYFGARDDLGNFSKEKMLETLNSSPSVIAIEIKLSQGAKAGLGGILPAAKITKEISEIRGIPMGVDCHSPSRHSAFSNSDELLDFVEEISASTGLPVGIKSAVGDLSLFKDLASKMSNDKNRAVDFITIDGGEGGTGAGPLTFTDHVSLPFMIGFPRIFEIFDEHNLTNNITFIGSGRLGLPERAVMAYALGVDMINVARESMLSIGCIQSQRCHTGTCPTGVATSNHWLNRGLDIERNSIRCANYIIELRKQLATIANICGFEHPTEISIEQIELINTMSK